MKNKLILAAILWTALTLWSWFSWFWQSIGGVIKNKKKDLKENLLIPKENLKTTSPIYKKDNNKINYDSLLKTNINNLTTQELREYTNHYLNKIRESQWLSALRLDDTANKVAQDYSRYLYENNMDEEITYEDHFDAQWNSVLERVRKAGMKIDPECRWDCKKAWEILASSNMTVEEMVNMRMKSEPHKQKILWNSFDCSWIWHYPWSNNVVVVFVNLNN